MKTLLNFKSAKMLAICLTVLLVVGCSRKMTSTGEIDISGGSEYCLDGVVYFMLGRGVSAKWNKDGTLKQCGN